MKARSAKRGYVRNERNMWRKRREWVDKVGQQLEPREPKEVRDSLFCVVF